MKSIVAYLLIVAGVAVSLIIGAAFLGGRVSHTFNDLNSAMDSQP